MRALLANAWVVERIADVPSGFLGIAVTRGGTAYSGAGREIRRHPAGAGERALAERNRQVELRAEHERLSAEPAGRGRRRWRPPQARCAEAEQQRELRGGRAAGSAARAHRGDESMRRAAWLIEQRRAHGGGPEDARRAELSGEIAAERRIVERLEHERAERESRRAGWRPSSSATGRCCRTPRR